MKARLIARLGDDETKPKLQAIEGQYGNQGATIEGVTYDAASGSYTVIANNTRPALSSGTLRALGLTEQDYQNAAVPPSTPNAASMRAFTIRAAALDTAAGMPVATPLILGEAESLRTTARSVIGTGVVVPAQNLEHANKLATRLEGALQNNNVNAAHEGNRDGRGRPRQQVDHSRPPVQTLPGGRAVVILTPQQATALGVEYPAPDSMKRMDKAAPARIEFVLRPNPYQEAAAMRAVYTHRKPGTSGYGEKPANPARDEVAIRATDQLGAEQLLFDLRRRHQSEPHGLPPRMDMHGAGDQRIVYMSPEQATSLGIDVGSLSRSASSAYDPLTPPGEAVAPPARVGLSY
jgi:hypothetical protein